MAEFPALPLWTDAYLADAGHLTDAEHGIYFQLLILAWRTPGCRIPNDDSWIARRLRRSVDDVQRDVRPVLQEFWTSDGNFLSQKRLKKEALYLRKKSKKQSGVAKARWDKEKEQCQDDATAVPDGMPDEYQKHAPTPTPTPTPTPIEERKKPTLSVNPEADSPTTPDLLNGHALVDEPKIDLRAAFEILWARYRVELQRPGSAGSKEDAFGHFKRHIKAGATVEQFTPAFEAYKASLIYEDNIGKSYVTRAEKWFRKDWRNEVNSPTAGVDAAIAELKERIL